MTEISGLASRTPAFVKVNRTKIPAKRKKTTIWGEKVCKNEGIRLASKNSDFVTSENRSHRSFKMIITNNVLIICRINCEVSKTKLHILVIRPFDIENRAGTAKTPAMSEVGCCARDLASSL